MPNLGLLELLIGIVLWVAFVALTAWLAAKKGYSPAVWTVIAVFFTFIALIVMLVLPARSRAA